MKLLQFHSTALYGSHLFTFTSYQYLKVTFQSDRTILNLLYRTHFRFTTHEQQFPRGSSPGASIRWQIITGLSLTSVSIPSLKFLLSSTWNPFSALIEFIYVSILVLDALLKCTYGRGCLIVCLSVCLSVCLLACLPVSVSPSICLEFNCK